MDESLMYKAFFVNQWDEWTFVILSHKNYLNNCNATHNTCVAEYPE